VQRKTDLAECLGNIRKLLEPGNIHIHLDLIAGLPHENYVSFAESFNGVYALGPHAIQLGFLKLLKGSGLRENAGRDGCLYQNLPPYGVLATPDLSFDELAVLKDIAECVDRLHNSGKFRMSLRYLIQNFSSPFAFFSAFAAHLSERGCFDRSLSQKELYELLAGFAHTLPAFTGGTDAESVLYELLKFDYFSSDNSCNPPAGLKRSAGSSGSDFRELYASRKGRRVHFERFAFDPRRFWETGKPGDSAVLCFDYSLKNPVSGQYEVTET
jgi:hypothetical protein